MKSLKTEGDFWLFEQWCAKQSRAFSIAANYFMALMDLNVKWVCLLRSFTAIQRRYVRCSLDLEVLVGNKEALNCCLSDANHADDTT